MTSPTRVLVIANETQEQPQRSTRRALAALVSLGVIDAASVFSLRMRVKATGTDAALRALLARIDEFDPTIVVAYHPAATGFYGDHWRAAREATGAYFLYYEGDPYARVRHSLPQEARALARVADEVVTVGSGVFADNFRRADARRVTWSPSRYNPASVTTTPPLTRRSTDIVMIANRSSSRLPTRTIPGARQRIEFVRLMERRFGSRFAIYGAGWTGPAARGVLPFWEQSAAIADSWLTVNWDHFPHEPHYFSNRLPISLASSSVHLTGLHPGYSEIFPADAQFIKFGATPTALVDVIDDVLASTTKSQLIEAEANARDWSSQHLRADSQIIEFLTQAGAPLPSIPNQALDQAPAGELEGI